MRSTLLCVFFTFFIQRGGSQTAKDEDFRPTPIPLDEWHHDNRGSLAGTLQETIKTESSAVAAAVPAHYWEDALRHSVYLTLVRDKIDQLISKGTIVSSDQKPDHTVSKEVDDRDLWHKIKTAPFERLRNEEPPTFSDITIMAKGRLLEEKDGFRFTEDEASKDKCDDDKCMEGVKAFWSVKRVRQRDVETSPGKYHYELTFSVTSKTSAQKQRKRYETPIRTFTVRENSSAEQYLENRINELKQSRLQRPQRAIWFHKNIVPTQHYQGRNYNQGLDRIFSSLFTYDDSFEDAPRYKQNNYVPQVFPQYSKIGHVGAPSEQHHQKKLMPYPYKPQSYKYTRPPLQAPPVPHSHHHYLDFDPMINLHYTPTYMDQRYVSSNPVKTTRPAVLPTPLISLPQLRNFTIEETNVNQANITDYTTKNPEVITPLTHKTYNKPKPTPIKISYFPDHVRPPVFSAPPGVFVTMDKKPFKPMPPLKLVHSSKPMRKQPTDFRPSPQVLDIQFSDPDPLQDSAFRPITVKYADNITESSVANRSKNKNSRKKPAKKHENVKSHRVTTTTFTPDIITAGSQSIEDRDEEMQWANVLGAFTRTTPMASQKERANATESFVFVPSVTVPITVTAPSTTTAASTTKAAEITTTKSATPRPKKRTRPPPKFTKPDKIKKHKRVTSTTTTTKAPEIILQTKKPQQDLTPQATSAATGGLKHKWEPKNKTTSTTPLTTSTETLTTSRSSTTTVVSIPTKDEDSYIATTQPKIKNRFRQSTLMQKGTSVKHDRWSTTNLDKTATKLAISPSGKLPTRRKGSNFHGYLPSSTPKYLDHEENKEDHKDHVSSPYMANTSNTTDNISEHNSEKPSTQPPYEDSLDERDRDSEIELDLLHNQDELNEDSDENIDKSDDFDSQEESNDEESIYQTEYIFQNTSTAPSETTNEIIEVVKLSPTEASVISSPQPVLRNKTKCKKKKHHNLTTTVETPKQSNEFENEIIVTKISSTPTTESSATPNIFEELFGGFTMDETSEKPKESQVTTKSEPDEGESENHERYVHIDDDFDDFLDSLNKKENHSDVKNKNEEEYEDDKDFSSDEEESPFNYEDENEAARNSKDDIYDEYHDRPYSLLELMAME